MDQKKIRSNLILSISNSCTSLGERKRETCLTLGQQRGESLCPSHGPIRGEKNQITSDFYVQPLDIYGEENNGDMSNSWTQKKRREVTFNNQPLVVRKKGERRASTTLKRTSFFMLKTSTCHLSLSLTPTTFWHPPVRFVP